MNSYRHTIGFAPLCFRFLVALIFSVVSMQGYASFDCEYNTVSTWDIGAVGSVTITNTGTEAAEWHQLTVTFPDAITIIRRWNNSPIKPGDSSGTFYPADWNKLLAPGQSADLGMQMSFATGTLITPPDLGGNCAAATQNSAPVSAFTLSVTDGEYEGLIHVDASTSYDPDGDPITYTWRLDGGEMAINEVQQSFYVQRGTHQVDLRVSDGKLSDVSSRTVTVGSVPIFTPDIQTDITGLTLEVDASASTSNHPITGYHWDFGDGSQLVDGAVMSHTYASAGSYTVALTLTTASASNTSSLDIVVSDGSNTPPEVTIDCRNVNSYGDNFEVGYNVTIPMVHCSAQATDADGDLLTYSWDAGDGSTPIQATSLQHAYVETGETTITLSVSDGFHTVQSQYTLMAVGTGHAPVGTMNCTTSSLTAQCDVQVTDEDNDTNTRYAVAWGDGDVTHMLPGGPDFIHSYASSGEYTITLHAWDQSNVFTTTQTVSVEDSGNTAPVISDLTCTTNQRNGDNFEIGAGITQHVTRCSAEVTDAEFDTLQYQWNLGNGSDPITYPSNTISYLYEEGGRYTISLSVSDGSTSTTASIDFDAVGNGIRPQPELTCNASGLTATCELSGFFPDGSSQQAVIVWGDGAQTRYLGATVNHTYETADTYAVRGFIWDKHYITYDTSSVTLAQVQTPLTCSYSIGGSWGNSFTGQITVTNTGDTVLDSWSVSWEYADNTTVDHLWNGVLSGSNPYSVSPNRWNATLAPGDSVVVGFNGVNGDSSASIPTLTCTP